MRTLKLLGPALSGAGLSFISVQVKHSADGNNGAVVCRTGAQCMAVAAWAAREGWNIVACVATPDEIAQAENL